MWPPGFRRLAILRDLFRVADVLQRRRRMHEVEGFGIVKSFEQAAADRFETRCNEFLPVG